MAGAREAWSAVTSWHGSRWQWWQFFDWVEVDGKKDWDNLHQTSICIHWHPFAITIYVSASILEVPAEVRKCPCSIQFSVEKWSRQGRLMYIDCFRTDGCRMLKDMMDAKWLGLIWRVLRWKLNKKRLVWMLGLRLICASCRSPFGITLQSCGRRACSVRKFLQCGKIFA